MFRVPLKTTTFITLLVSVTRVNAAEICGNGADDDGDGLADEGCYPTLTTGQCESPLSCEDTGMVSPSTGSLHYSLPPDVAPKVPFGPGIGFRRFYLSQYDATGASPPTFQAAGTAVGGTGSVSPSWPTHQANDVALLIVETAGGEAATLSSAQGFTAVSGAAYGDNADLDGTRLTLFWKRASSSSEAAPTVADSGDHQLAMIVTFRGVTKTGDPWDVPNANATSGTGTNTFTMPTAATTKARMLVTNIVSWSTPISSWIQINWDVRTESASATTTAGNDGAFSVAVEDQSIPGATSATTGFFWNSHFDTESSQRQARMVIALKGDASTRAPMGERWSHTYMSWLDKWTAPNPDQVVVHTSRGQDVLFSYSTTTTVDGSTWSVFTPPPGFKNKYRDVIQRTTSPNEYRLRTLTGETIVYDSAGKMTEIWDTLQTPNKVLVAYDGNNQVSTVTDASGNRRLLFSYSSNLLSSVAFQIKLSGTWTTEHTTSYSYTNGLPTTVTIGGTTAQTNTYSNGHLTEIDDGGGLTIAKFVHDGTTAGKIVRIETGRGVLGWEYNSSRDICLSKTVLYFNKGNTTSCSVDSDCGSGFLCGGKTGSGSTGQCFRGARCLTLSSPSEDVITGVTAFGPGTESCDGACLDALSYTWNTSSGALDLKATEDPSSKFITKTFDSNGLPTKIVYGDSDSDPTNGGGTREVYLYYGNSSFPGKLTEVRRKSDLSTAASSCSSSSETGCARTVYTYNADGMLSQLDQIGTTSTGADITTFTYTTTYAYNTSHKDLIETIDGPLSGSNDVTQFAYWSSTDKLKDGFLQELKRKKDSSTYLTQETLTFDFWGNPTSMKDVDNTVTCMTFDSAFGFLSQQREQMAGQTDCTTNSADIVTSWDRDTFQRVTKITRPDGSCVHFAYDSMGRLDTVKRRDDCNAASSGDKMQYTYSADGLVTKIEVFDASNTVTRRQELTYFDSRRLEKMINPVNTAKHTLMSYDARGMVNEVAAVDGSTNLSRTAWTFDNEGRVSTEKRYTAGTSFDTWTLLLDWLGSQKQVTDPDSKVTASPRDDLGRMVKLDNPDLGGYPTIRLFDAASRLTTVKERFGGSGQQDHSFTFDNLGRPLNSDYAGACAVSGTGVAQAEIQRVYDDEPASTCPSGMSCTGSEGRLAYVKVSLMCNSTYAGSDGSLDQETWYQYDAAGRVIREYIKDDSGRTADHQYVWTKNGALKEVTTPSGAVLGSTYGSSTPNSDTDRITALWRTSSSTPVIDNVLWNPFGPLQQYNQMNSISSNALRTKITRNLAYRISELAVEKQSDGSDTFTVTITEDAKGRVVTRDYSNAASGVQDSYFLYDQQDRVLCETTSSASSCPTSGSTIKNSHTASPPFTGAGDWKQLLRPIPGSTGLTHGISLVGTGTHQIATVNQSDGTPTIGRTSISHNTLGNRSYDDNQETLTYDRRDYGYDGRRNVVTVSGKYKNGSNWDDYVVTSAFDAKNRRVYKSFTDTTASKTADWFFYYDALDRLVEIRHTPDTSSSSTYSVFQLFWLDDRIVLYWQTDYPSASASKRYVATDESVRPIDMWSWPSSGDAARVWAVDPNAWGFDVNKVGPSTFQPLLFAGQYLDAETVAFHNDGSTPHRPGVAINGYRFYDPFTGSYFQTDPLIASTWQSYSYASNDPVGKSDPAGLLAVSLGVSQGDSLFGTDCTFKTSVFETGQSIEGGGDQKCWFGYRAWTWGDGPWILPGEGGPDPDPYGNTRKKGIAADCQYAGSRCPPKNTFSMQCWKLRCEASYCSDPFWTGTPCNKTVQDISDAARNEYQHLECAEVVLATAAGCNPSALPPCNPTTPCGYLDN